MRLLASPRDPLSVGAKTRTGKLAFQVEPRAIGRALADDLLYGRSFRCTFEGVYLGIVSASAQRSRSDEAGGVEAFLILNVPESEWHIAAAANQFHESDTGTLELEET